MKLTIKTATLKDMVARVAKGVGNNKLLPLTSMIGVSLADNVLTLTSNDGTNYLYIRQDKIDGDDFNITVPAEIFTKLISKMTSENVTLSLDDKILEVKGNGKYSIELELDEEGELIDYPDPLADVKLKTPEKINHSTVLEMLAKLKPSLAVTQEMPQYTGYYAGDTIIATDTIQIAGLGTRLFKNDVLIAPEFLNLFEVMQNEKIDAYLQDDLIICQTKDCTIYGHIMEDIEDYQYDALVARIETDFPSSCKLPKEELLQVLDRLSLFVTKYDNNGVQLTFTKDGLQISSKADSGVEVIPYIESKDFKDFTAAIDITMLLAQLKALDEESVSIEYGDEDCLKLTEGNTSIVLAYLGDDEIEEDENEEE